MVGRIAVALTVTVLGMPGCGGSSRAPARSAAPVGPGEDLMPPQHYRAELDGDVLRLALWLPPSDGPRRVDLPDFPGRETRRDQVRDVACDGAPLAAAADGGWDAPASCEKLTWRVEPDDAEATVDPALQRSVRGPDWWFFTGASIFLGPRGERSTGTLDLIVPDAVPVFTALPHGDRMGLSLPGPPHVARVMIGLGDLTERTTSDGRTRYRHLYTGEPPSEAGATSQPHAQGASYLARATDAEAPDHVDVFWFGRDPADRTVTGAAGVDAIAASYFTSALPEDAPARARHAPLMVLLHEHFHLLTGSRLPEWASESLAQYFALRALVNAGTMTEEDLDAFLTPFTQDDEAPPLLDTDQRGRFYTRGAAYWHELHRGIVEGSSGARGLDDALPLVLDLVFVDGGRPPQRFFGILAGSGLRGDAGRAISHRYLGWPEPESEEAPLEGTGDAERPPTG